MEHARPPSELFMEGAPVSRGDVWKRWRQQFNLFVKAFGGDSESFGVRASLYVNLIGTEGFDVYQTFSLEKDNDDVNDYVINCINCKVNLVSILILKST